MHASIFRRLLPLAVLVTAAGLILHAAAARPDAGEIQELIAAGRLPAALDRAERELKADPGNVTYRFLKGLILTRQDRLEEARDVFLGITRSNPELPEPYNNLAVIHAAMGDFDLARQALEQAINTHPAYATAHENIGDIYAKLASQAYNQALELDTSNNTARAKLSLVNELFSLPDASQAVMLAGAESPARPDQAFEQSPAAPQPRPPESAPVQAPAPAVAEAPLSSGSPQPVRPPAPRAEVTPPPRQEPAEAAPAQGFVRTPAAERPDREEHAAAVAAIKQTVMDWASAWSEQDVEAYLSHYAGDFSPDEGLTLVQWRSQRRERVGSPGAITVTISDLVVEMLGGDHAQATFTQVYQSDTYGDRVKKTLLFKREEGRWLITLEETK